MITTQTPKYPHFQFSSGIFTKFMPYSPTMKDRGMNTDEMIVSTYMITIIRLLMLERYTSSIPEIISRKVSTMSMIWMVWSYRSRI